MKINGKVLEYLIKDPRTRDDDRLLIAYVLRDVYGTQDTFEILNNEDIKGNIYETIRRERQHIQKNNPLLWSSRKIKRMRKEKEERMRREFSGV